MTPRRRASWLAWIGAFLLFASVAHGNFETTDAGFTMHAARSLWLRGDSALLTKAEGGALVGEQLGAAYIKDSEARGGRINGKIGANGHAYVWFPMGHVFLLVPFVAVGDWLQGALPDADERLRRAGGTFQQTWIEGHPVVTQGLISLLLPALCLATSLLLAFRIARALGASGRDAVWTALAIGFATQAFALGREQLSDGPGLTLLLAALLQVVRLHVASTPAGAGGAGDAAAGRATAWWAGVWSGAAVLLRYQTAFAVVAFAAVVALACRRRAAWGDLLRFALGGLPFLIVFVATNQLRFGDPLDTGYPEVSDWFTASPLGGLLKLLFAAGRGVMWFSPVLWLGLPLLLGRGRRVTLRWLAWVLFLTPLLLFMTARGWQGGQAWAVRYVTPGVVALLVIGLPQTTPWRRWPRLWWGLVAAGLLVNATSVVAPVRGQLQLASQAVRAELERAVAAGECSAAEADAVDPADLAGWHPRYTPLLANWRYALRSKVGGFEDDQGRPAHGGAGTIEPLYGVAAVRPEHGRAPLHWTDRRFRHLWWRFWGDLYQVSGLLLVLPFVLLGALCAWLGFRGLCRSSDSATPG